MNKAEAMEKAREIAVCSCHNRSQKMVDGNYHYSNCAAELVEEIADLVMEAHAKAVREEREEIALLVECMGMGSQDSEDMAQAIRAREVPNE